MKLKATFPQHHHIDHTGGLWDVIKAAAKPVTVYAHPGLFNEGYLNRSGCKYIGVPFCRGGFGSPMPSKNR